METIYDILLAAAELLAPREPDSDLDTVKWAADAYLRASQLRRIAMEEFGSAEKE
jgi:hypothetical protein